MCIIMYCDIFASGMLFTETKKMFELNWFNAAIATTGRLGLRWLPTVSWKVGEMQIFAFSKRSLGYLGTEKKNETYEGLLRTRISSLEHNKWSIWQRGTVILYRVWKHWTVWSEFSLSSLLTWHWSVSNALTQSALTL